MRKIGVKLRVFLINKNPSFSIHARISKQIKKKKGNLGKNLRRNKFLTTLNYSFDYKKSTLHRFLFIPIFVLWLMIIINKINRIKIFKTTLNLACKLERKIILLMLI